MNRDQLDKELMREFKQQGTAVILTLLTLIALIVMLNKGYI